MADSEYHTIDRRFTFRCIKRNYICTLLSVFSIGTACILLLSSTGTAIRIMIINGTQIRTNVATTQSIDVRAHLREFGSARWYGRPRSLSVTNIPRFPPQMTIVKVCSICKNSYWMAFPTNLTLGHYYFAGENGIRIQMARGIWDLAETRLANAVLSFGCRSGNSPALMVDVGMNIAYFSGMALAAGCRVVAFEPTAYHHPYAAVTAMLSGYEDRFTLHKVAASNKTGEKIPYDDWSIDAAAKSQTDGQNMSYVFTTRVDDIVHENVLYLKVDVEGHEPTVFQGLSELLKNKVVLVILWEHSTYGNIGSAPLPADYLKSLGYFISDIHHGGAGNFLALHPQIDPVLREIIMSMKESNINDTYAGRGLNWFDY